MRERLRVQDIATRFVTIHDMRSLDQTKEKRTALQIFDSSGGANGVLNLCDLLHLSGQDVGQEIFYQTRASLFYQFSETNGFN